MKIFRIQIKHVCDDIFAPVTICINWRMIVDVDFGALHFCSPRDAKSRYVENAQKCQKFGFSKLAPIVPEKCFATKFTSMIILQFIEMVTGAKISSQSCFI